MSKIPDSNSIPYTAFDSSKPLRDSSMPLGEDVSNLKSKKLTQSLNETIDNLTKESHSTERLKKLRDRLSSQPTPEGEKVNNNSSEFAHANEWEMLKDEDGQQYYHNTKTGEK